MRIAAKDLSIRWFWASLGILFGFVFAQYALGVAIHSVLYLVVIASVAFACRKEELLSFFACLIPINAMVGLTYILAVCLVVYLIRFFDEIRFNLATACVVLLMAIWELVHYAAGVFSPIDYAVAFVPLAVLLLFVSTDVSRLDYSLVARGFALTALGVCLALLGNMLAATGYDLQLVFTGKERLGMSLAESTDGVVTIVHPNTLGIICSLASTLLMQLSVSGRGSRFDLCLVVALLVFGAMTLSKTFLVCFAVSAILLFFSMDESRSGKVKFVIGLAVAIALGCLLLDVFFPGLLDYFYARFQEEDITTGRTTSMAAYHDFIMTEPRVMFFGVGLQDLHEKLVVRESIAAFDPHNGIQELVIAWGVEGLLMFCILIGLMLKLSRACNRNQKLINYIPLLLILLKIQAGQMMTSSYTMLAFSLAYISLCCDFTREKSSR